MRTAAAFLVVLVVGCGGSVALVQEDPAATSSGADPGSATDRGEPEDTRAPNVPAGDEDASRTTDHLLARCANNRNVFWWDVESPGLFAVGEKRLTNLDASWRTSVSPLEVSAHAGDGTGARFAVWMPGEVLPQPGVYAQGPFTAETGPSLHPVFDAAICAVQSGSVTITELSTATDDGGVTRLVSLLAAFDVNCQGHSSPVPVRGCVRYGASP